MDLVITILLIAIITLLVAVFKELKKMNTVSADKPEEKQVKRKLTQAEKKKRELHERQMTNFLSYTGDKQ